jgi:serine/threonine protein kinase
MEHAAIDGEQPVDSAVSNRDGVRLGLASYRLGETVGTGGVGVVRRAIDLRTGERCAIKIARQAGAEYGDTIAREVSWLKHLEHPGIVRLRDHCVDGPTPWYAMELLDGATLREAMEGIWCRIGPAQSELLTRNGHGTHRRIGARFLAEAVHVVEELCRTLSYLHGRGLVHADVKPENVFLCNDGRVVLLDFGAAQPNHLPGLVAQGDWVTFGTWTYMAPECRSGAPFDHRADVYAVGCILHEFAIGRTPLEYAFRRKRPEASAAPPMDHVPGALSDLIGRLTAFEARLRPDDLREILPELDRVCMDSELLKGATDAVESR